MDVDPYRLIAQEPSSLIAPIGLFHLTLFRQYAVFMPRKSKLDWYISGMEPAEIQLYPDLALLRYHFLQGNFLHNCNMFMPQITIL